MWLGRWETILWREKINRSIRKPRRKTSPNRADRAVGGGVEL